MSDFQRDFQILIESQPNLSSSHLSVTKQKGREGGRKEGKNGGRKERMEGGRKERMKEWREGWRKGGKIYKTLKEGNFNQEESQVVSFAVLL